MRIIIEGTEELLVKLERIQNLAKELYRECGGVFPITEIRSNDKENAACDDSTDGEQSIKLV